MIARVGIVGDVHGQAKRLETALDFLRGLSPDAIFCTGDIPVKGGTMSVQSAQTANDCARLLSDANVHTVRGNHDRYLAENAADTLLADLFPDEWEAGREALRFVRALPATREFETPRGKLLLCHGVGERDVAGIYPTGDTASVREILETQGIIAGGISVLIAGHTHQRMHRTVAGITLINPGTLLPERDAPGFAFADFAARTTQFYKMQGDRIVADAAYSG